MYTTIPIAKECIEILMEGTPINIELEDFKQKLKGIEGVESIHDLHIWSLTSGRYAVSAHIITKYP